MKNILKLTLALAAFVCMGSVSASAQKFGFVNSSEIITTMPEMDEAQKNMEAFATDLQEVFEEMMVEYNNMLETFRNESATYSEAMRAKKEGDLAEKGERLQTFQQNAQQQMQQKEGELMEPIVSKAREAIEKVGRDNGFTAVFDLATGALIYHNPSQMTDITDLVKKELNITR